METEFSRSQHKSTVSLTCYHRACYMQEAAAGGLHSPHSVAGGPSLENCSIYLGVANYHYVMHIY